MKNFWKHLPLGRRIILPIICFFFLLLAYNTTKLQPASKEAAINYLESLGWSPKYISQEINTFNDGSPLTGSTIYHHIDTPLVVPFASPLQSGTIQLFPDAQYTIFHIELIENIFEITPYSDSHLIAYVLMDENEVICCQLYWLGVLFPNYLRNEGFSWPCNHSFSSMYIPENFCPATWSLAKVYDFYCGLILEHQSNHDQ